VEHVRHENSGTFVPEHAMPDSDAGDPTSQRITMDRRN
jgi:hypothetical protein